MSSWNAVYQGLRNQIIGALDGLVPANSITIGYSATFLLQTAGQPDNILAQNAQTLDNSPIVMVYDRGMSRDVTRWIPYQATPWVVTEPEVTFSLASPYLSYDQSATLDILSPGAAGDALGISVNGPGLVTGAVFTASGATSVEGFASGIASAVNEDLAGILSATVSGGTVILTNESAGDLILNANAANLASSLYEVHRVRRSAQVIVLANRPSALDLVGEPLAQLFGELEVTYGYQLPTGNYVRLINEGDIVLWDNVQANLARRDWMLSLEYGVDLTNTGYAVLAPALNLDVGFGLSIDLQ